MSILDRIVAHTRRELAARKETVPRETLEASPLFATPTRSLAAALRRDELAILAECKRASPSQGVIREAYDVPEIAEAYEAAGAAALSVLTEPAFFEGHLDHLALARQATDLPILRKDFIVDVYQLLEARAYGADAVLLIAAVLEASELHDLHQAADDLGLACLVELYEPHELDRIDFSQVQILGVNNRDLRTFEVDVEHSLRVFREVPAGVVRVSESGLRTADDLAHLRRHGIDAVLIGETFMRAAQPGEALAALRRDVRTLLAEN